MHGATMKIEKESFKSDGLTVTLDQRFSTFLTRGALFRINFYGGAP